MSTVSTHVLDTARGRGAVGVAVRLERLVDRAAQVVGEGISDGDGRVRDLGSDLVPGTYRLVFATGDYFTGLGQDALFPRVTVEFRKGLDDALVADPTWRALAAELDDQQLMDLVFTVGAYDAVAMASRSFGVELYDDLVGWPAAST